MKNKFFVLLFSALLATTGCIRFGSAEPEAVLGVFRTDTAGEEWVDKNAFIYPNGVATISGVGVTSVIFDPLDPDAMYLTTNNSGVLYSYNNAETWQQVANLGDAVVQDLVVDPTNKCVLYATLANTIVKTADCGRTWGEVYVDTRADVVVTAMAIDLGSGRTLYAGNSKGEVLKMVNGGGEWRTVTRLESQIVKLLIEPLDSSVVYAATQSSGLFKTQDAGLVWSSMSDGLKPFSSSFEYRNVILDPAVNNGVLWVSRYGLLRSSDGGETWNEIKLITPPATTDIFAVAINPQNPNELYYSTSSTFYRSTDGGVNWTTRRLPTAGTPSVLVFDPNSNSTLFMGIR